MLKLGQLKDCTSTQIWDTLIEQWGATKEDKKKYNLIICYSHTGDWGCDSSGFFLLQDKQTEKYFEVHGSHCSCYGFEEQFVPRPSTKKYLQSEHFTFSNGGYDGEDSKAIAAAWLKEHI